MLLFTRHLGRAHGSQEVLAHAMSDNGVTDAVDDVLEH